MLDSLDVKQTADGIEILITDRERQAVVTYQEDATKKRAFLYISSNEEEIIDDYIIEIIDNILKNSSN